MTSVTRRTARCGAILAAVLSTGILGPWDSWAAGAAGIDADDLLQGPFPTTSYVAESGYYGSVDEILFCVGTERCDEDGVRSATIPEPLHMSMNGAEWDEYIMLVTGEGTDVFGPISFTNATVRVMLPEHWNGRVFYYNHGASGDLAAIFGLQSNLVEAEYLVDQGWAVVTQQEFDVAPKQRNLQATDDSYWTQMAQYYFERYVLGLETFTTVDWIAPFCEECFPRGTSNVPAQRSIGGVVKNLITRHFEREPTVTILAGHSFAGLWMTDMMMGTWWEGRTGGNYNIPYDPTSGLVFDGFFGYALESPLYLGPMDADPEYPITAPFVMLSGEYDCANLHSSGVVFPVAAHRALLATDESGAYIADPTLSRDLNDWFRIYHIAGENHINRGSFLAGRYNGGNWYYDPDLGLNTEGVGRRLSWQSAAFLDYVGFLGFFIEAEALWGHEKPLSEPLLAQALFNLADYIEYDTPMPPSRIDPDYLGRQAWDVLKSPEYEVLPSWDWYNLDPDLDGLFEDSLESQQFNLWEPYYLWANKINPNGVHAYAYLTDPTVGYDYVVGSLEMPNYTARTGIYVTDWQRQYFKPFTEDELRNGYTHDDFVFEGYPDHGAYVDRFADQRSTLIDAGLYDPVLSNDQVAEAAKRPIP